MYNIISFIIYGFLSAYITLYVGWQFYKKGEVYLKFLIKDWSISEAANRILLLGYYLVNLGYIAITLRQWEVINTLAQLISFVAFKTGLIMLLLGGLHYVNLFIIYLLSNHSLTIKNTKS